LEHHASWQGLANFITPDVLDKLEPARDVKAILSEQYERELEQEEAKAEKEDNEEEKGLEETVEEIEKKLEEEDQRRGKGEKNEAKYIEAFGQVFFTDIPRIKVQAGSKAKEAEVTAMNFDKSAILEDLIKGEYGGKGEMVLGEL